MTIPYIKQDDASTLAMSRYDCVNEEQELQRALGLNPDLIPGDQIDPNDPRRWLVIAREMPVPDPSSGCNRWSIDFLFADQSAKPTLIEVKRFGDTRSRREVIGQMFEYAANGPQYWDAAQLRAMAVKTAQDDGSELDTRLTELGIDDDLDGESYFPRMVENLKEGLLRIVFFIDRAPSELKVLVEFLNRQMERSEILLVEAAHYRSDGLQIVVPQLFGYSEAARQVKRTLPRAAAARRQWDAATFLATAGNRLPAPELDRLRHVIAEAGRWGATLGWPDSVTGTFHLIWPDLDSAYLLAFRSDGRMEVNLRLKQDKDVRDAISTVVDDSLGLAGRATQFPLFTVTEWSGEIDHLLEALADIAEHRAQANTDGR